MSGGVARRRHEDKGGHRDVWTGSGEQDRVAAREHEPEGGPLRVGTRADLGTHEHGASQGA